MASRRLPPILLALAVVGGCSSDASGPDHLSLDERTAYLILVDQLQQLPSHFIDPTRPVNLCVTVASQTGGERAIDDRFLASLRDDTPAQLNATLLPVGKCTKQNGVEPYRFPDGAPAWEISAFLQTGNRDVWSGSIVCGGLCGWGNFYRVDVRSGRLSVTRIGEFMS